MTNFSKDTGWWLPGGEKPHGKGLGGQEAVQDTAKCPSCKGGQQHPELCVQGPGHEMEAGHYPEYYIQILNPKPREDVGKLVWVWEGLPGCVEHRALLL